MAKDYIVDFSKSEGDKLDLSDLLDSDGSKSESSLKSLLSVFQDSEGCICKSRRAVRRR